MTIDIPTESTAEAFRRGQDEERTRCIAIARRAITSRSGPDWNQACLTIIEQIVEQA